MYDHVLRISDSLDTYRELLSATLDSSLTQTSNRLATVTKTLSVLATLSIPFVIVSGMWGMNFAHIPLQERPDGFWLMLALQVLLGLGGGGRPALEAAHMSSIQLFGVVATHGAPEGISAAGAELVTFRDVGAVVAPAEYAPAATLDLAHYRRVVECVFRQQEILPAQPGVIFRTRDVLVQWLELHYFTLLDALAFVEERAMARVVVERRGDGLDPAELDEAAETVLQDALRVLRRHSVATVTFGGGDDEPATATSFLVQQERWELFTDLVRTESERLSEYRLDVSGPWPPYDFIRMQFTS